MQSHLALVDAVFLLTGEQDTDTRLRPQMPSLLPAYIRPSLLIQRHQTTEAAATLDSQDSIRTTEVTRVNEAIRGIGLDSTLEQSTFEGSQKGVLFETGDLKTKRNSLPSIWLRDNCRCSECVNQDTMQRNFDTFKVLPPPFAPFQPAVPGLGKITDVPSQIPVDIHPKSYKKTETDLSITCE